MEPERPIAPSTLSVKDLPWQILWDLEKCTLCGKCTAVCPVNAIELGALMNPLGVLPLTELLHPSLLVQLRPGDG